MKVLYVIGLPGSGKTSMVEAALEMTCMPPKPMLEEPVPHTRYDDWLWHIGKPRDAFGGTDTLSMGIQPTAIRWVGDIDGECDVLLGEGDRLANDGFFAACPNLTIIYLDTPLWLARQRGADRAESLGRKPQDASWWKGRVTKVDNLIARHRYVHYDGRLPLYALAGDLADALIAAKSPRPRRAR
jgi:hypothetical protein